MENYLYICHYCGIKYKPNRRNKQLYCSNSCRVNSFNIKKNIKIQNNKTGLAIPEQKKGNEQKINLAGIGNAAIANIATDLAKTIFTREENKPATKGDIQTLLAKTNGRFFRVSNIPVRNDGAIAYYDMELKSVVYLNNQPKWN